MSSSATTIDQINEAFAREHLDVRSTSGDELICLCPYHGDTHPSFWVNIAKGLFLCYACGAKGTIEQLANHLEAELDTSGVQERERQWGTELAMALAGARALEHKPMVGNGLTERSESELAVFRGNGAHRYWTDIRGFSAATCERYELGYDPVTNRVTIPLRSIGGQYLGAIKRAITADNMPRYKYPYKVPVSKVLWGANLVIDQRRVVLVEGSIDAIKCWSAGVPAVAMLGSWASPEKLHLLRTIGADSWVVMTDRDKAGRELEAQLLGELGHRASKALWLPEEESNGSDPDMLSSDRLRLATGFGQQLA